MIQKIRGGLSAPAQFVSGSVSSQVKTVESTRLDTALVLSQVPCSAAATFTTNVVKAAPVLVSMEHLDAGKTRAVILNSGNANACTGPGGLKTAKRMAAAAAKKVGLKPEQVLVCSTGRIGVPMPIERLEAGIAKISLGVSNSLKCAKAIMTSDTFPKEIAIEVKTRDGSFRVGGIAKGAGMIDPNMATMLCVITTDAAVPAAALRKTLKAVVADSFNRITVDGDMSTNDTVIALANGASKVKPTADVLQKALTFVAQELARMIVLDGEGVSRFVAVEVRNAASPADARLAAEAVANSMLVKCAWAGGDPNWGRIMDAVGYSGAKMIENKTNIFYDDLPVAKGGLLAPTPWKKVRAVAAKKEFRVTIDLRVGKANYTVWTTDLTEAYVKFNLGE